MLAAIAAMAENRVIGRGGALPWRLPDEMAHFKRSTLGRVCIMGRATFDEGGTPLPGRTSIVITRDRDWTHPGVHSVHSVAGALDLAHGLVIADGGEAAIADPDRCPIVIGGGQIYAATLDRVDVLDLTTVHAEIEGDTRFPDLDGGSWSESSRSIHAADGQHEYAFTIVRYLRKMPR